MGAGVQLAAHVPLSTQLEPDRDVCIICNGEFEHSAELDEHMCAVHGFVFGCYGVECDADFVTVVDLKRHVREVHNQ